MDIWKIMDKYELLDKTMLDALRHPIAGKYLNNVIDHEGFNHYAYKVRRYLQIKQLQ